MPRFRRLGSDAEDRAAAYLTEMGYTIVKRGFKSPTGEIDILALDGDVLVIVEVKERTRADTSPEESITPAKAQRLGSAANAYLQSVGEKLREIRFDVICFDPKGMRHHIDAFRP